jgi:hypothetical protein
MNRTRAHPLNLRCRILHQHRWVTRSTEDGTRYETCSRCGRDQNDWLGGPGAMGAVGGGV